MKCARQIHPALCSNCPQRKGIRVGIEVAEGSEKAADCVLQTAAFAAVQSDFDRRERIPVSRQFTRNTFFGLDSGLNQVVPKCFDSGNFDTCSNEFSVNIGGGGFGKLRPSARVSGRVDVGDILPCQADAELIGVQSPPPDFKRGKVYAHRAPPVEYFKIGAR